MINANESEERTQEKVNSNNERKRILSNENLQPSPSKLLQTELGLGNIVATHYNQIKEKGLQERNLSKIVYMRNFNNWVKSILLLKYLDQIRDKSNFKQQIVALDLCCGKGGDLFKWQKANIAHLICADIASTSISQCQERYQNLKQRGRVFSAEFLVADCTKTRLIRHIKDSDTKADIVSSQFSFHYCFESLSQAETMIQNVSDVLKEGGFFVATIPDANKIVSRLKKAGQSSFGNQVFKIEFPEDRSEDPPLFGDKYNFFLEGVVNCPEFLVHFPTLVRLCKKYGLELVYKKSFEELYKEGQNSPETRNLLFKMRALEIYPASQAYSLSSSEEEDYSHAQNYIQETNVRTVKTISQSEWEAICLYMAFSFKKVK